MTAATPRPPDLTHARQQVRAIIAGSSMARQAPSARARTPLTFLDPVTEAKLAKRAAAGFAIGPARFPRRNVLLRTVLPSAALASLDAVLLVVALAAGNTILVIIAAVLLVALAGIAFGGWQHVAGDPLRLTLGELRAIAGARTWHSKQDWTGPQVGVGERGLVLAAADAATRISRTPFWRSGQVHDVHVHLDLVRELDAIDARAHRLAAGADAITGAGPGPDAAAFDALLDRVAALTAYANQVDGYEQRREAIAGHNRRVNSATSTPSDTDERELVALLYFLNALGPG